MHMKANKINLYLAWLIFVLWALGLVVLPALSGSAQMIEPNTLVGVAASLYLLLQAGIFIFALYLSVLHVLRAPRKKTAGFYGQLLLYAFVLVTLAVSFCFILSTWLF